VTVSSVTCDSLYTVAVDLVVCSYHVTHDATEDVLKTEFSLTCDIKTKKAAIMKLQQQKHVGKINLKDSRGVVKSVWLMEKSTVGRIFDP